MRLSYNGSEIAKGKYLTRKARDSLNGFPWYQWLSNLKESQHGKIYGSAFCRYCKASEKESATKEGMKPDGINIYVSLPYCANNLTVSLPFSVETVRPFHENSTAMVWLHIH